MKKVIIAPASIFALPTINRLFAHAVRRHFTYFPSDIQDRVIREHAVPKLLRAALDPRRIILVARVNGRIVGYCIGAAPTTGPAQLFWLYVDPDHRGANLGLSLLSRMLKRLAERGAQTVVIATHDHRRYYERQGFKFLHKTTVDGVQMDVLSFKLKT
jgi:ribosomal protein S18 acetylase RimI-like enzyme